jgi:putative FmdB family regulatory protein
MPVFEFLCERCQHEFEELLLRRDEEVLCPQCGANRAKKLMSAFAVTGSARLSNSACGSCKPSAGKCSGCGGH